ncbi:MAG: sigma-70 family RNA polymerase sigma factor [Planctomycetota bacterium]
MSNAPSPRRPAGPSTSPSLLLRIRDASDVESWEIFQSIYGPIVRAFCLSKGLDRNDVDDITQNVMAKVFSAIERFEYDPERGRFRSWLGTVTANTLRDYLRQSRSQVQAAIVERIEAFVAKPDGRDWSDHFVQRVFQVACRRVRLDFEEVTWQCFHATWFNHEKPAEVAARLGIQMHSVYVNKSRVLKRLEQELKLLTDDFPLVDLPGELK